MSCEKMMDTSCVCRLLSRIAEKQRANPECLGGCRESLGELRCGENIFNTIPIQLICAKTENELQEGTCGTVFIARGFRRDPNNNGTIITATSTYFRVSKVDEETCCAELELLCAEGIIPSTGSVICPTPITPTFTRTGICITMDLKCFCGVVCLPAVFAEFAPINSV